MPNFTVDQVMEIMNR
jgi:elongation factor 2